MRDWIERYGQHSLLAVLGNSVGFLYIFFVCGSDICILIKISKMREM